MPVVLTRQEVRAVLSRLEGDKWLMASLMCGAGLRLAECLRLRVQDVDLEANQILVRDGKGFKDRITMLPEAVKRPLADHLEDVKRIHTRDVADGYGRVALPDALARKYPKAAWEWRWQHVFPQEHRWVNARTGEQGRYHMDESLIQRAVKVAVHSAGITKHATCHTLRHSGVYPAHCAGPRTPPSAGRGMISGPYRSCSVILRSAEYWLHRSPRCSVRGEGPRPCTGPAARAQPSPRTLPRGADRHPSSDSPPDCAVREGLSPNLRTAQ